MQQEALLIGALKAVDILLVFARAERRDDERLRLAAGEEGGAMRSRQHADLGEDRPHRADVAPVDADACVEDVPAHHLGLQVMENLVDLLFREACLAALGEEFGGDFRLDRVDGVVALLLGGDLVGLAQFRLGDPAHRRLDVALVGDDEIARLLGGFFGQLDDRVDHRLEAAMAGHDGLQHHRLGELLRLQFDHQHGVARAGDDEIERRFLQFVDGRVQLQGAVDVADARRRRPAP